MSQSTAVRVARPVARPAARGTSARPTGRSTPLRVVGTPSSANPRAGLVVGCLMLLGLGLVALLVLNVSLDKGAFVLRQQQADSNRLLAQRQALQEQLAALAAPGRLEAQARQQGMVRPPNVAFVRPGDGQILGVSKMAPPPPRPSVAPGADSSGSAPTGAPVPAVPGAANGAAGVPSSAGASTTGSDRPKTGRKPKVKAVAGGSTTTGTH